MTRPDVAQAYTTIFRTAVGETVLADLWERCGGMKSSFDPDPHVTAFQEGQRNVLLYILALCEQIGLPTQIERETE